MNDDKEILYERGSTVLNRVLTNLMKNRERRTVSVHEHWQYIIGPSMGKYAHYEKVDRLTLVVKCDHAMGRSVVLQQRARIVDRWNECFPKARIRYIKAIL